MQDMRFVVADGLRVVILQHSPPGVRARLGLLLSSQSGRGLIASSFLVNSLVPLMLFPSRSRSVGVVS